MASSCIHSFINFAAQEFWQRDSCTPTAACLEAEENKDAPLKDVLTTAWTFSHLPSIRKFDGQPTTEDCLDQ